MNLRNSALKTKSQSRVSKPNFAKYFLPAALSLALAASSFLPAKAENQVKIQDMTVKKVEICGDYDSQNEKFNRAIWLDVNEFFQKYDVKYPGHNVSIYLGVDPNKREYSEASIELTDENVKAEINLSQLQQAINNAGIDINLITADAIAIKLGIEGPKKLIERGNVGYNLLGIWHANADQLTEEEAYTLIMEAVKQGNYEAKKFQTTENRDLYLFIFNTPKGTILAVDGNGWLEVNGPGPDELPEGVIISSGWIAIANFSNIPIAFGRGNLLGVNNPSTDQVFLLTAGSEPGGKDGLAYGPTDIRYNNLYIFKENNNVVPILNIDHKYLITFINDIKNIYLTAYVKLVEFMDQLLAAKL